MPSPLLPITTLNIVVPEITPLELSLDPLPSTSASAPESVSPLLYGRLRAHWQEWEKLKPNKLVSSIIRSGYVIRWIQNKHPPAMWHKNGSKVYEQPEFVSAQLATVQALGVIEVCQRTDLHCILALDLLPKPDGAKRLILNGHPLKKYELPRPFKMEHLWKEGRYLFAGCTHGSIIDISNAFYHIDLAPVSQKYVGFEWLGLFYRYCSLPQGIASAPAIFTEVTLPMVRSWRARGIRVLKYLDDFPSGALSGLQQRLHCHFMVEHTRSLGFFLKDTKLVGYPDPMPEIFALGTLISFTSQQFCLRPNQIDNILALVSHLAASRTCPVRLLSRLAGLIVSRAHCLGPAARMRTRAMYSNMEDRLKPHEKIPPTNAQSIGWSRQVHLRATTKAEFTFWLTNIHRVNGQPFQRTLIHPVLDLDLDTDASKNGWGAILSLPDPASPPDPCLLQAARLALPPHMTLEAITTALQHGIRIHGLFSRSESTESSNARELLATLYSFRSLLPFLQDLHLNHHMDNLGAVQALGGLIPSYAERISGGSTTPRIQEIVIQIDDCCIDANIDRHTIWVPRDLNIIADYMSKLGSGDAYSFTVQPWVRTLLDDTFGAHSIDRFASHNNVQVVPPRYNSLYFEPNAEWLDAFSCHWTWSPQATLENNWIHPPYQLMGQALQHLAHCEARGTIIFPRWEAAPWWPHIQALLPSRTTAARPNAPAATLRLLELGPAPHVLCFSSDSKYSPAHLPHGTILALHFPGPDNP